MISHGHSANKIHRKPLYFVILLSLLCLMMFLMTSRIPMTSLVKRPTCMARPRLINALRPRPTAQVKTSGHRPLMTRAMPATGPLGPSSPNQFKLLRVTGDGSCLFRAMAQGDHLAKGSSEPMSESEETKAARGLRLAVVKEMSARRESIEPFIPGILDGDLTFEAYLARMSLPYTWGGEPEMVMAMNLLQRPIHVWRIVEGQVEPIVSYGVNEFASSSSVNLLWHQAGHYDALVVGKRSE